MNEYNQTKKTDELDRIVEIDEVQEFEGIEEIDELEELTRDNLSPSSQEDIPLEPWQALSFYLEKFRIISSNDDKTREGQATEFLKQASEVKLPYVTTVGGELTPYRIYPIAAYRIINAAVKVLEKEIEKSIQDKNTARLDHDVIVGIATIADTLFSGACTHPEGNFLIHRIDQKTGELVLKGHGRRIKQLATRLSRWHTVYKDLLEESGSNLELLPLSCRQVVAQEISSSQQRFRITQGINFEGSSPLDSSDSIEALKENTGREPGVGFTAQTMDSTYWADSSLGDEKREQWEEEIAQANWIGINVPQNLKFRESIRGNVLSENPKDWLWTYDEAPLDFIVNYVSTHAKPCLEEAHTLLIEAAENADLKPLGTFAQTLDPKNKVNPDSYWKIIKRIANHFPSSQPESENISKKLDTARFVLSLSAVNKKLNIDDTIFLKNYQKAVYEAIDKSRTGSELITRNTVLLSALEETSPQMSSNEKDQWLEHLQSFAVGAYENSTAMEQERKKMLARINHLFKTPREELEKAKHNENENKDSVEKLNNVINSAAGAFYKYLSGKTGQMTRRELRTKIQSMKVWAEQRGDTKLVKELGEMTKFISSISSQIKLGQWYSNEKENKEKLFNFLLTMLKTPKPLKGPEFLGSTEPKAKDPLEITIDFLRSYGEEKMVPPGKHTITEVLNLCKTRQSADDGVELALALSEITKNKSETLPIIKERERALAGAIEISQKLQESTAPIKDIADIFEKELEILETEEAATGILDPFEDPQTPIISSNNELKTNSKEAREWVDKKINEFKQAQTNPEDENHEQSPNWLKNVRQVENMTRVLVEISNRNSLKEANDFLNQNRELQKIINNRLEKNLRFWKGINYIGQNIQSRRENEKYQVSPTGRGTLQNIIAIVKAKIQGREVTLDPSHKKFVDNKTLRQFKISRTRQRTLVMNAGIPIALWLAKDTKGTKTIINKDDFIKTLQARHKACQVCLQLNQKDKSITEKLHQYNEREREDKNAINTHIIDQCITMLEDKEGLTRGLELINEHRIDIKEITPKDPACDTPNLIYKSMNIKNPAALNSPNKRDSKPKQKEYQKEVEIH